MMAKEVVYIADDLGMSSEINDAIFHAHENGGLTGAALMMSQNATSDAVARARELPSLQIGWHLHLTDSIPSTTGRWPWGSSPAKAGWSIGLLPSARKLMRAEVARQWQLYRETGLPCHFINSHHHLHAHPFVYHALKEVVGPDFPGWIRLGRPRFFDPGTVITTLPFATAEIIQHRRRRLSPWRSTDTLWGLDRLFQMKAAEVRPTVENLGDGFHEFLFHPRTKTCPDTQCLIDLRSSR